MFAVCICVFFAVSAVHLAACIMDRQKLCTVTKPLLMPLLALSGIVLLVPNLPEARITLVCLVAALAFGTAGDALLLSTDQKHFMAGAGSFLVGHFFWIAQYASVYRTVKVPLLVGLIALYAALLVVAWFAAGKPKGVFGAAVMLYGVILCALNCTGLIAVITLGGSGTWCYFIGSLLFLASDAMLGFTVMRSNFPQSQFLIMLTYIAAQALLTTAVLTPFLAR